MIAVDLVAAAKAGDQAAFANHDARWTANIREIARFLAGANPNWPEKDVFDLLALHLKLTKDETVARIRGDWAADVKAFDDIFTEILVVADTLHDGLAAQFPDRFALVPRRMTSIDLAQASPEPATLPIGAAGPAFEGLLRHRWQDVRSLELRGPRRARPDLLVEPLPTAKAYGERMNALQREFGPRGVQLVALNANDPHLYPDESYRGWSSGPAEDGYTFPYLVDEGQRVARAYGAACTFHVFVLDRDRRLRYQGRFDDSRIPERVTSHDLANALEDVLAGGKSASADASVRLLARLRLRTPAPGAPLSSWAGARRRSGIQRSFGAASIGRPTVRCASTSWPCRAPRTVATMLWRNARAGGMTWGSALCCSSLVQQLLVRSLPIEFVDMAIDFPGDERGVTQGAHRAHTLLPLVAGVATAWPDLGPSLAVRRRRHIGRLPDRTQDVTSNRGVAALSSKEEGSALGIARRRRRWRPARSLDLWRRIGRWPPRVSSPTFVGRRRELEDATTALDRARDGHPAVVLVAGEAGVGKTRFIHEIEWRALERGDRVLAGGCVQLGGEGLPFGPIIEALRGLPERAGAGAARRASRQRTS